jgi:malonate transporter and related proteins
MGAILTALGTIGAIVATGWALGHRGTLGPTGAAVLARIVFTIATPCLIFVTVGHADLHLLTSRTTLVTVLSTTTVVAMAIIVMRGFWRQPMADVTVAALASSYLSGGSLGLSIAVYLLGDALAVVPTLLFQLLVLAPAAFAVLDTRAVPPIEAAGVASTAGDSDPAHPARRRRHVNGALVARDVVSRTLRNPIIVGALSGLTLDILPWRLPEVVFEPFSVIGAAAVPLALLTLGMSLAVPRSRDTVPAPRELALVVILRSVVHPVLAAMIGTAFGLDGRDLLAVTAMAALPTAQNVLVFAMQFGRKEPLARDAGLFTTALAVPVLLVIAAVLA